jgi:hypothetical protein
MMNVFNVFFNVALMVDNHLDRNTASLTIIKGRTL